MADEMTHYRRLGVGENATPAEIKEAFHYCSHAFHPDKMPAALRQKATADFRLIHESFEILSDPEQRKQYDQQLKRDRTVIVVPPRNKPPTPPPPDTTRHPYGEKATGYPVQKPQPSSPTPQSQQRATNTTPSQIFTNSLGMKFAPVSGTDVQFCVWHTRVQDYDAFASATGRRVENPSFQQEPTHPVANVSWDDSRAFCKWLTEKERSEGKLTGVQSYRLPMDWEWSVAVGLNEAKEGTPKDKNCKIKDVYPWGNQWPPPRGVGNYHKSLGVDDFEYTSPVESFAANKFGLYDMGGNLWQWCEDFFNGSDGARVSRGGSWFIDYQGFLLSSVRRNDLPTHRSAVIGFRVVLVGGAAH